MGDGTEDNTVKVIALPEESIDDKDNRKIEMGIISPTVDDDNGENRNSPDVKTAKENEV